MTTSTHGQCAPLTFDEAVDRYQKWLNSMTGITIPSPPVSDLSHVEGGRLMLKNEKGLLAICHPTGRILACSSQHRSNKTYRVTLEAMVKVEVDVDAGSELEARFKAQGWTPTGGWEGACPPGWFWTEDGDLSYEDEEMYWQILDVSDVSNLDAVEVSDSDEDAA